MQHGEKEMEYEPDIVLASGVTWANKLVKWTIYEEDVWIDSSDDTLPYDSPQ